MIYDDIGRDGILSLANARRDANLSRMGATDQYEADVADFINSEVTDIENNLMSGGNTFVDPFNIQPPSMPPDDFSDQIFVPPIDNIYDDIFEPPVDVPPPFIPPVDVPPPFIPPVDVPPPFTPPIDIPIMPPRPPRPPRPPGDGPIRPPFDDDIVYPPDEPPFDDGPIVPPDDPPYIPPPPVDTPIPTRRMYRPPTDFSSGVPSIRLSPGISTRTFGQAPGYVTTPIKRPIYKPPQVPPKEPPKPEGMKFGGPLNAGIMMLPQSQQGDTMTTRIFQNAFKPRR